VDLMMQASAQKVQEARAEQNKPPSEADKANALKQAGEIADAGVKAAMVVTAPNYIASRRDHDNSESR